MMGMIIKYSKLHARKLMESNNEELKIIIYGLSRKA